MVPSDAGPTIGGVAGVPGAAPRFLFELASAVADDKLEASHALTALAAAGVPSDEAAAEDLAHALWLASVRHEERPEAVERLADLARVCQERGRVTRRLLLETQELPLLEAGGQVAGQGFKTREVRAHTKATYQQNKYGLLREANEGYAKMLALLNSAGGQPGDQGAAPLEAVLSEARALIGFFSLDPNRCVVGCCC